MIRLLGLLIVCLYPLGATAVAAGEPDWRTWAAEAQGRHALAGRVYDVALGKLSDLADGGRLLLPEGIVLLGEVHDNPAHHRLRAWLIEQTARARLRWRPGLVFEQIDADKQGALDDFRAFAERAQRMPTTDDLFKRLQWDKSGWPPAEIYMPLFQAAISAHLPIFAGDPPRDRVRAVARGGASAVSAEERARLRLDAPMPGSLAEALRRELADSHCGALPPQAIPGMAAAQRYRDARLADVLLRAAARHGSAILIAGNGHVRSDRGVPWHVRERAPETRVTTVLVVEVEDGKTDPAAYVPRDPEGKPAADMVIFTPTVERGDPCRSLFKNSK
jgi:uncharacterized iron-regulated protein